MSAAPSSAGAMAAAAQAGSITSGGHAHKPPTVVAAKHKKFWTKPRLLHDWENADEERKASWSELFYDLIYVASAIRLGEEFKKDISWDQVGSFFVHFGLFWWSWHASHGFFARFSSSDRVMEMLFFMHMLGVLSMGVHVDLKQPLYEFAVSYIINRLALFLMYFLVYWHVKRAKFLVKRILLSYLVSMALFAISAVIDEKNTYLVLWVAGLVVELGVATYPTRKHKHRLPMHVEHTAERQGLFIMLIIGESVISLSSGIASVDENLRIEHYIILAFGFGLAFNLHLSYFDASPFEAEFHAMRQSRLKGRVVLYAHLLLSGTLLLVGVSLKIAEQHAVSGFETAELWLFAVSASASLLTLQLINIMHDITPSLERHKNRNYALRAMRLIVPIMMLLVPVFTDNWSVFATVILVTTLATLHVGIETVALTVNSIMHSHPAEILSRQQTLATFSGYLDPYGDSSTVEGGATEMKRRDPDDELETSSSISQGSSTDPQLVSVTMREPGDPPGSLQTAITRQHDIKPNPKHKQLADMLKMDPDETREWLLEGVKVENSLPEDFSISAEDLFATSEMELWNIFGNADGARIQEAISIMLRELHPAVQSKLDHDHDA